MIQLSPYPTAEELGELYARFYSAPLTFSEKEIAGLIETSRQDPRLAEVITEHLRDFWWKYDPEILNKRLKKTKWPNAICVMLSQIHELSDSEEDTRRSFADWSGQTRRGLKRPRGNQLFFYSSFIPGSKTMQREVVESKDCYVRNGYFGRDILFNKQNPKSIGVPKTSSIISEKDLAKLEVRRKILELKKSKRWKNKDIAMAAGTDNTTVSNIISGKLDKVSLDYMYDKLNALSKA